MFMTSKNSARRAASSMAFSARHKHGKSFFRLKGVAKRCQQVKDNKEPDWRHAIVTDESAIEMRCKVTIRWTIRRSGEEYLP